MDEPPDPLHLLEIIDAAESDYFQDTGLTADKGTFDDKQLLMATKRSLEKFTSSLLKDTTIDDKTLLSNVFETNRRGEQKMIAKIVCPYCRTLIAPQFRPGGRRLDLNNFNRHLVKMHGGGGQL